MLPQLLFKLCNFSIKDLDFLIEILIIYVQIDVLFGVGPFA